MGLTRITSDGITNGAIALVDMGAASVGTSQLAAGAVTNDKVSSSAAIAGSKISPDFGSQNIATTGTIASDNISITGATPKLTFTDNNANPDYEIRNHSGYFAIRDATSDVNKIRVNPDGHIDIHAFLECLNSLSVTGNITVTGTVDGVDIAARNTLFGGLTSSSGVLTNGVTATTQSASDNSTKVATTAYTDTAISNLVDSSPSALNTLNELAAALGDDANFSTTVTNSIATKLANIVEDTSPQLGGPLNTNGRIIKWPDSTGTTVNRAVFGAGDDLMIYHNGSDSVIREQGTGNLDIQTTGGNVDILVNTTEHAAKFISNGAVELYHNGSKKFETLASGVEITGRLGVGQPPNTRLNAKLSVFTATGNDDASDWGADGIFQLDHQGTQASGSEVLMLGAASGGVGQIASGFGFGRESTSNWGTFISFKTHSTSTANIDELIERWRITSAGHLENNSDTGRLKLGASDDLQIYHDGSNSHVTSGTGQFFLSSSNSNIWLRGTEAGLLNTDGSEYMIRATSNGSVKLFHDNSQKMLTSSTGIEVDFRIAASGDENTYVNLGNPADQWQFYTGGVDRLFLTGGPSDAGTVQIRGDNNKLQLGASQDLELFFDGTHSRLIHTPATGDLVIQSDDIYLTDENGGEYYFRGIKNGAVELYYDNSKKFETISTGASIDNTCRIENVNNKVSSMVNSKQNIEFKVHQTNGQSALQAAVKSNGVSGWGGQLEFYTKNADGNPSGSLIGYLTLNVNGHLLPTFNGTQDLGGSSQRWRNLYTSDLNLSNEGLSNDVDGTWGSYTIQEGEESLFLINKRNGKKYKFNLTEVS